MKPNSDLFVPSQSRRQFVKAFAQFGAYFALCAPVCRYFVGEVQAQTANLTGLFNVDLAVAPFTALRNLNGSLRVEVPNGAGITELGVNSPTPSIIITRVATSGNSQFGSLGQRCTHAGTSVNPMAVGQTFLVCPNHGSRFNPSTGAIVLGPATVPLTPYLTTFTPRAGIPGDGTLQIRIAGIGYTMAGNAVGSLAGPRVQLQFPTRAGSNYEVRFRSAVTDTNSLLSFSTTQHGIISSTNIAGSGAVQSVFVPAPQQVGFYIITALP